MAVSRLSRVLGAAVVTLWACSPDNPPTSPEGVPAALATIAPCPFGGLCGSTDGKLHDGTGNGTLVMVPGDPSPGASGRDPGGPPRALSGAHASR
jgi:hypothetical protein